MLHDAKSLYQNQLEAIREASAKVGQTEIDWALATDGLRAEREQRITIDVAYRHFSTPRRRFIIADTPGHEQYTRNMVTGASTADLAVILIDATRGVLPQSQRHGYLASLLGIRKLLVAVNKMDLVDYREDVFQTIRQAYASWAALLPDAELDFIPISALRGDNVVEGRRHAVARRPPLLRYLETVEIPRTTSAGLRLPIQHVLRPNGTFRGYCGTIAAGQVELGGEVIALPSGRRTRVSRILCPDGERNAAGAPRSVTLCLADDLDLGRGDLLASPEQPPTTATSLTADLVWMAEAPLDPSQTWLVKQTTRMVRGQVTELHGKTDPVSLVREPATTLALNEVGRVSLRLLQPLVCEPYATNRAMGGFILIDPVSNGTVAGGMNVRERRRSDRGGQWSTAAAAPLTRHFVPAHAWSRARCWVSNRSVSGSPAQRGGKSPSPMPWRSADRGRQSLRGARRRQRTPWPELRSRLRAEGSRREYPSRRGSRQTVLRGRADRDHGVHLAVSRGPRPGTGYFGRVAVRRDVPRRLVERLRSAGSEGLVP